MKLLNTIKAALTTHDPVRILAQHIYAGAPVVTIGATATVVTVGAAVVSAPVVAKVAATVAVTSVGVTAVNAGIAAFRLRRAAIATTPVVPATPASAK